MALAEEVKCLAELFGHYVGFISDDGVR